MPLGSPQPSDISCHRVDLAPACVLCCPAGKAAAGGDAPDIPEDELAEDIYAGEEDELRPTNPRGEVRRNERACVHMHVLSMVCCVYVCMGGGMRTGWRWSLAAD